MSSTIFGATTGSNASGGVATATTYTPTTATNASGNAKSTAGSSNLTEQDFLNLMVSQMENQDPTNPISNSDMASQMAQYSTLTGINTLNSTTQAMSGLNQLTSAANMIGKSVTTDMTDANGAAISGLVTAAGASNGTLTLTVNGSQIGLADITGIQQPTVGS